MSRRKKSRRQQVAPPSERRRPVVQPAPPRWILWLIPALIALVTVAAFEPVLRNGFVGGWDDSRNLLENTHYRGLGGPQLRWMFTAFHVGHYMPLTWMTLGLDYLLWGLEPFGYHLTSLLLHAASAVVLYFVARRLLTAALPGPAQQSQTALALSAAAVALLFALHPLRVESVAWATERRDVLSGFFYLSTILAYLRFCQQGERRWGWYWTSLTLSACALLSKSIAVSLPVVLLILDVYPLRRLGGTAGGWGPHARPVYLEKLPFVLLAGATSGIAFLALFHLKNMAPLDQIGLGSRLAISAYSLGFYLWKTLVPVHLSPLYELAVEVDPWTPAFLLGYGAAGAITALAVGLRRRMPGLAAAWLAYVVILLPVLGIFQNGPQIGADRYTYLACVGWAILAGGCLLVWWRLAPFVATGLVACVLLALGALAWNQTKIWRDSETLWTHALAIDPGSAIASNNLGPDLVARGRVVEAIARYRQALRVKPRYAEAHNNLGIALVRQGQPAEAIVHYQQALRLKPDLAEAHNNWGLALVDLGKPAEAIGHYQEAARINPGYVDPHHNWGNALTSKGEFGEAIAQYQQALRLRPDDADIHLNWGVALARQGQLAEAIAQYRQALRLRPDLAEAYNDWGLALADQGQLAEAIGLYQEAVRIKPGYADPHYNWGNVLARQGQLAEAIAHYEQAVRSRPDYAEAHNNWGVALERQGQLAEAISHYQEAVRIRPDLAEASNNLARVRTRQGQAAEAIRRVP